VLNSFHFNVQAVSLVTTDAPKQGSRCLSFTEGRWQNTGQVLECNHGKPVGSLTVTKSGLTCGEHKSGGMTVDGSDSDDELRAGTPDQFSIVGIDGGTEAGKTKFGLVALVLPKDEDGN
jgi:hypothetical protein